LAACVYNGYIWTFSYAAITKYMVNNKDLNEIFAPYVSGNKAPETKFKVNTKDLNEIFATL
jgi:hypothetical protein